MALKSLELSFIYNHLNRSNGITKSVSSLIANAIPVQLEWLEESLITIYKNYGHPWKATVRNEIEEGRLKLLYNERTKLPTCMPFFLAKGKNNTVMPIVSLDLYGVFNKERTAIRIDPKKLYCLLESAYMAKVIFLHQNQISTSPTIKSAGSEVYSSMFTRVLNKKYALNVDRNKYHKVILLSSKFFLVNILGNKDDATTFNYAIKNCPNGSLLILEETNSIATEEHFKDFGTFMELLTSPELGLGLKDLTIRNYLEAFITMYDASNLLSLESFPYFMYNVNSVVTGAYLNNQYILDAIVSNCGSDLCHELFLMDTNKHR